MPVKPRSFDIGGETFTLSTGDFKKIEQMLKVIKETKNLYDATLAVKKKIYEIEVSMALIRTKDGKTLKEDTKINRERVVIFKKLQEQLVERQRIAFEILKTETMGRKAFVYPKRAVIPPNRTFTPPVPAPKAMFEIDEMLKESMSESVKKVKGAIDSGDKEEAKIGVKEGFLAGIGLLLVKGLEKALNQSKIVSTVMGHVGNLLGLLVDVILLPFLPLIIWGVLMLLKGIMTFKPIWDALVSFLGQPLSIALLAGTALAAFLAASVIYKTVSLLLDAASAALYAFLTSGKVLPTIFGNLSLIWGGIIGAAGYLLTWLEMLIASGIGGAVLAYTIAIGLGVAAGAIVIWFMNLLGLFDQIGKAGEEWRRNSEANFAALPGYLKPFIDTVKYLLDLYTQFLNMLGVNVLGSSKMNEWIQAGKYDATVMQRLKEKYGEGVGYYNAKYWLNGKEITQYAKGGIVPGTGPQIAVVHGGEEITPPGQSRGDITLNFYGYQDDKFIQKVKDVLRQQGANYRL